MKQVNGIEAGKAIAANDITFVEKVLDSRGFIGKGAGKAFTNADRVRMSNFFTFASIEAKGDNLTDEMADLLIERGCVTVDVFSFALYVLGMFGDDDADYDIVPVSVKDYISKREFDSTEKFEEETEKFEEEIENLGREAFISLLAWIVNEVETAHIRVCYPIIKYVRDYMLYEDDLFMLMSCSLKPVVSTGDSNLDRMFDDSDEEDEEGDHKRLILPGDDPFADIILGALLGFPI